MYTKIQVLPMYFGALAEKGKPLQQGEVQALVARHLPDPKADKPIRVPQRA